VGHRAVTIFASRGAGTVQIKNGHLLIDSREPSRQNFRPCSVKAMKRTDIRKVVEKAQDWIELQRLMAASQIWGFLTTEGHRLIDPDK
jgi:hypothetical protein